MPRVTYALIAITWPPSSPSGQFPSPATCAAPSYKKGFWRRARSTKPNQYWRLVTSAFLHENFIHIGFNMYLLYLLGLMLEPAIGSLRFGVIDFTALLTGAFGACSRRPVRPSVPRVRSSG